MELITALVAQALLPAVSTIVSTPLQPAELRP